MAHSIIKFKISYACACLCVSTSRQPSSSHFLVEIINKFGYISLPICSLADSTYKLGYKRNVEEIDIEIKIYIDIKHEMYALR